MINKMFIQKFVKEALSSKPLWGWGVLFVLFWGIIGAYLSKPNLSYIPQEYLTDAYKLYATGWISSLIVMNISNIGVGLTFIIIYITGSLSHISLNIAN